MKIRVVMFVLTLVVSLPIDVGAQIRPRDQRPPGCQNLVVQGGFEGSGGGWTTVPGPGLSNNGPEIQSGQSGPAQQGRQYLEVASDGPTWVRQVVRTQPNATYVFGFAYRPRRGFDSSVDVWWNNEIVAALLRPGPGNPGRRWRYFEKTVTASATGNDQIDFRDVSTPDAGGALIDDVYLCLQQLDVTARNELEYSCDRMNSYRATVWLKIQGGTPPFTCSGPANNFPLTTYARECSGIVPTGSHHFSVQDATGTQKEIDVDVEWVVTARLMDIDPPCCNCENGAATVGIGGKHPPFTLRWNDARQQTTRTANSLRAGTYRVSVTDEQGCRVYLDVEVPSGC